MADEVETFVNGLNDLGDKAKKDILKFIRDSRKETSAFLKRQGKKLAIYIEQLAAGKITKKEFGGLVEDLRALTILHALGLSAAAKRKANAFAGKVEELVLTSLVEAL